MAPSPPVGTPNRSITFLGAGAVLAGSLAYVGIGDPHSSSFAFPTCPLRMLTGLYCPLCGGLRMTHDLLHGDLAAAFVDNAFALIGLPLLFAWLMLRRYRGKPAWDVTLLVVIVIAALTWTIARNLPGFPLVPTVLDG